MSTHENIPQVIFSHLINTWKFIFCIVLMNIWNFIWTHLVNRGKGRESYSNRSSDKLNFDILISYNNQVIYGF